MATTKRSTTARKSTRASTTRSGGTKRANGRSTGKAGGGSAAHDRRPTARATGPASARKSPNAKKSSTAKATKTTKTRSTATKTPRHRDDAAEHYTDPALRERLKAEIIAGDKGGRAGQWSARKAQLLAHAYEAAGGGYVGAKSETQRHLDEWTAEEWTTRDGAPARRGATTARYLPKEAWEHLSPAERAATDDKKRAASRRGRQFVANTAPAKRARAETTTHDAPAPRGRSAASSKGAAEGTERATTRSRTAGTSRAGTSGAKRPTKRPTER